MKNAKFNIVLLILFSAFGLALGCNGKTNTKEEPKAEEVKAKDGNRTEDPKVETKPTADANANPASVYKGLGMTALPQNQQAAVVEIAKAELCPCPESAMSLHECLQDEAKRCNV